MGLRNAIREEIIATAQRILETEELGISLVGLQFKHVNYTERVRANVFNRMISYQQRIAETYRAEGESSRQQIEGKRVKELQRIRSEAYAEEQEIKGAADAEATAIYAEAYEQDPDFFAFLRTLDTYRSTADEKTTLVFSADSEYYRQLVSPNEMSDSPRSRLRAAE